MMTEEKIKNPTMTANPISVSYTHLKFLRGDRNILCYARFNRAQQFIIVVNNDGYTRSMEIGVCGAGVPSSCQMTQIRCV